MILPLSIPSSKRLLKSSKASTGNLFVLVHWIFFLLLETQLWIIISMAGENHLHFFKQSYSLFCFSLTIPFSFFLVFILVCSFLSQVKNFLLLSLLIDERHMHQWKPESKAAERCFWVLFSLMMWSSTENNVTLFTLIGIQPEIVCMFKSHKGCCLLWYSSVWVHKLKVSALYTFQHSFFNFLLCTQAGFFVVVVVSQWHSSIIFLLGW